MGYDLIKEHILEVDKTGEGRYTELMGSDLGYIYCWDGDNTTKRLSERNPSYYYRLRFLEYVKTKGESRYRIATDTIEAVYRDGKRIE